MPRIRSRAGVCGGPFRPFGFRSIRPGRSIRPELEALEDRLLPATAIWSGASLVNSNWSTPQNWQANIAPSSGADLVFPAGAAQQSSVDDFPSGTTFHSITFSAGASDSYFLDGNNNLRLLAGITDNGTNTQPNVINISQLTLGANQQFTFQNSSSNLDINSPVSLQSFTLSLNSTISFGMFGTSGGLRGVVSGSGAIIKTGIGGWYLASDNTYTGLATISQGDLAITTANGLGAAGPNSGTVVQAGASLILNPNSTDINIPEPITINGTGSNDPEPGAIVVYHAFAIPTLTGPLTLASASTIFTANDPAFVPKFEISGPVNTNGFNLTLAGNLVTILTNSGTVSGSGKVIQNAQLLSGTGTINCPVTVSQGTISPGNNGPGILNTADVTFQSGTTYQETMAGAAAGSGYSQLLVNGAVSLSNCTLNAALTFTPTASSSFVIMESTGSVTGTFNGLPDGASLTLNGAPFLIHYVNSPTTAGGVGPDAFFGRVVLASTPLNTFAIVTASQNPASSQGVTLTSSVVGVINAPAAQGGVSFLGGPNLPATGSVQFIDGATPLGSPVNLTNGVGSLSAMLTVGSHSITAVYTSNSNNFSGTTSAAFALMVNGAGWHDVLTGDFLGNGKQDIAGRTATGQWWVAVSTGSSFTNQLWTTWNEAAGWRDVVVGDFNNDGKTDIAGRTSGGQWWVALSTGSSFTNSLWDTWSTIPTWVDVKVGDFNGDGKADIVGRYLETGQWWVAQSTGSSFTNSLWTTWNPAATWVDVQVGDFSGDKKSDFTGRYLQGGQWWTALSTGSSFTTSLWASWNPAATWVDVRVGDFSGDGKADLTARYLQGGQWWTAVSTGSSFTTSLWASWNPNVTWVDVRVGDFNGDGKADITGRYLQTGQWWTAISTGSSFTTSLWVTWSPAANWVDVSAADINNDGSTDLVGRYGATGQWWAGVSNGSSAFTNQLWTTWAP